MTKEQMIKRLEEEIEKYKNKGSKYRELYEANEDKEDKVDKMYCRMCFEEFLTAYQTKEMLEKLLNDFTH